MGTKEGHLILHQAFSEALAARTVTELDAMPRFLTLVVSSPTLDPEYLKGIEEIGLNTRQTHHPKVRQGFFNNLHSLARVRRHRKDTDSYTKIVVYLEQESNSSEPDWSAAASNALKRLQTEPE